MDKNKDLIIDKTFNLALKNHQQNKLEEAKNLYNQVLEMNPNHSQAYYNQGLLFHTSGQKIKARKFYEKAISLPIHPKITKKDLLKVTHTIKNLLINE